MENSVRDRRHHPDKGDLAEILAAEWVGMRIDLIDESAINHWCVEPHRHEVTGYGGIDRLPVPKVA